MTGLQLVTARQASRRTGEKLTLGIDPPSLLLLPRLRRDKKAKRRKLKIMTTKRKRAPKAKARSTSKKFRMKDFASTGSKKAKDIGKFVYENRKEIMEVIALLGSLLAIGKGIKKIKK